MAHKVPSSGKPDTHYDSCWDLAGATASLGSVGQTLHRSRTSALSSDDLPAPRGFFRSDGNEALYDDATTRWDAVLAAHETKTGAPAKGKALAWIFLRSQITGALRFWCFVGIACSAFGGLLGTAGKFLVLRRMIAGVTDGGGGTRVALDALLFTAILALEGLCAVIARQVLAGHVIHALVARSNALLSRKAPKLADDSGQPALAAVFGADMPKALAFMKFMSMLPCGVAALLGGVTILVIFLGPPSLVCLGLMVLTVFGQGTLTQRSRKLEKVQMAARDRRTGAIGAAIASAKAVKLYAWEEQYLEQIGKRRDEQVDLVTKYRAYVALSVNIGKSFPVVAGAVTLMVVAATRGGALDAENAFSALAVLQTLRVGMIMLPLSIVLANTFLQIFERVGEILVAPEAAAPSPIPDGDAAAIRFRAAVAVRGAAVPAAAVATDEAKVELLEAPAHDFSLTCGDLAIKRGGVTAVVGGVGSGKSTLLDACLGRAALSKGGVASSQKAGYAPQQPFVASGTVLENILLGRPLDEDAFSKAVAVASLGRDLGLLPEGRDTTVGERGTTLSGGQQHRLGVARAVYGDPELLLLDASLAAVDAAVARGIFDALKAWAAEDPKRCVAIVLSQLHFLPECDRVVLLDKGRVLVDGTHLDVQRGAWPDGSFAAFAAAALTGNAEPEKTVDDVAAPEAVAVAEKEPDAGEAAPLIKQEKIRRGLIASDVLVMFARAVGWYRVWAVVAGYLLAGGVLACTDVVLARWTAAPKGGRARRLMALYGAGSLIYLIVLCLSSLYSVYAVARGGRGLHRDSIATVLAAPLSWFESVPSGRILSRFAADFDVLDLEWGNMVDGFLSMSTMFLMLLVAMCAIVPALIPINVGVSLALAYSLGAINVANRDVKRLANAAVAPTVTNAVEMGAGRSVAGAVGCSEFFAKRQRVFLDESLKAAYQSNGISNACYMQATLWCSIMALGCALVISLAPGVAPKAVAPVALTYALISPYFAAMMSEVYLMMNLMATSLERIAEYMPSERGGGVPGEAAREAEADAKAGARWPAAGRVVFDDVSLRYRPGLPLALKGASFTCEAGSKVGIVGRTGAGKSTILVGLFRLVDVFGGSIKIDGVDTATLGLKLLRRRLCIIPQEATLLTGTARQNLDPFDEHSLKDCTRVLEAVGLSKSLLDAPLEDDSLSGGERQLLALARALLRRSRVVCFDEATAHVDAATDQKILEVVDREFRASTLIAIAHRLHTIIAFDRIVVMSEGRVAETGVPSELLNRTEGPFATMTAALGPAAKEELRELAGRRKRASFSDDGLDDDASD